MANIDLSKYGITGAVEVLHNPSYEVLFQEETKAGLEGFEKGQETELGAVNVMTGVYTGRSPKDKFFVMDEVSKDTVWWTSDEYKNDNKPVTEATWAVLKDLAVKELSGKKLYVMDTFCGANENSRIRVPLQTAAKYISRAREGAMGIPTLPYDEQSGSAPRLDFDAMRKYPSLKWLENNGVSKAYGSKLMEEYMGGDWTGRDVSDKDFDYIMPSNVARREMDHIMAQQEQDEENKAKGLPTKAEREEADRKARADAQENVKNLMAQTEQVKTDENISAGIQQMESWNVDPPKEIETPKRETGSGAKVPDVNDPETPEAIASQTKPVEKSVNDMTEESFQMESLRDMMCGIMKKGDKAGHPYGRPMEGNVFAYGSTISKMGEDKDPVMPKEISEASTEDEGISRKKLDIKKI